MTALEQALKYLDARPYSCSALRRKLFQLNKFESFEIDSALDYCRSRGFLNDALLAEDYAGSLASRNMGDRRIRRELSLKGLREHAGEALESIGITSEERADGAAAYKLRLLIRESDMRKKREKCLRFLLSRGFDMGTAVAAYNRALAAEEAAAAEGDTGETAPEV